MEEERQKETIDILNGSLIKNILLFVWPLMLSNILQITFQFADTLVVGNFASKQGLAAVGTTAPITVFFMWGLNGLSMGANVLVSRLIGARKHEGIKKAVFSGVFIGLVAGTAVSLFGVLFASMMLKWQSTPADIMKDATLYLRIYFLCGAAIGIFDFGSSVLRASGDTRNPTVYLAVSGALNVMLNLLFVVVFRLNVAGVAIATVISQYFGAFLILKKLLKNNSIVSLEIDRENYDSEMAGKILAYGIPSALQNQLFSFSNMIVQSSINSFGSTFVAANTAACAIEEYVYVFVDAFPQASLTFTSQMYGAGQYKKIRKLIIESVLMGSIGAFAIGLFILLNGNTLLGLLSDESEVIRLGMIRLRCVTLFLFLNGALDVVVNSIRGMGLSNLPTIITLFGVCGFRLAYIFTYFSTHHTPQVLYLCFPLSWTITLSAQLILWIVVYNRILSGNE